MINKGLGKVALFVGGVLFGSAGIKAALRVKEYVMDTATNLQENVNDILAEAKDINDNRKTEEEIIEDSSSSEA